MKIKGLTKQQTTALLWCGDRWRRIRSQATGVFRGKGIRPYVEYDVQRDPQIHGGFRARVRLTPAGVDLLASVGVTEFPYYREWPTGAPAEAA